MADHTSIEWTDATWNPITGCSVVSPGCTNCYAMRLAGTRLQHHPSRVGLTRDSKAGHVWTGETRLNEAWLTQPLCWKRPRRIFVCAHGDLFAESVPDAWIDRVFAVMALAPQHVFQVLTKRARRMHEYFRGLETRQPQDNNMTLYPSVALCREAANAGLIGKTLADQRTLSLCAWPLPNVWLGVSAEDQTRADERIPDLLATPAAVRWVSAEPLLGPIDLFGPDMEGPLTNGEPSLQQIENDPTGWRVVRYGVSQLDWIVVGGESGADARPMNPQWAREIRDQCAAANVPFFLKQNGEFASVSQVDGAGDHHTFDDGRTVRRVGKTRAGRLLDGLAHDAMPEAR